MQKLVCFSLHELVLDPDAVAAALNMACAGRRGRYRISGLCQVEDALYFALVEHPRGRPAERYLFRTQADITAAGLTAALFEFWSQGLDIIGGVASGSDRILLLAQAAPGRRRAAARSPA